MAKIVQFSAPSQASIADARCERSACGSAVDPKSEHPSTVVRLEPRSACFHSAFARRHPRRLLADVYSAGSLSVPADDLTTKLLAVTLSSLGFLVVEEIQADGTARRIGTRKHRSPSDPRPWRLLRPAFGGPEGTPDAVSSEAHLMPMPQQGDKNRSQPERGTQEPC